MRTTDQRERNLFNATDTMTQFYDEIESFMEILFRNMERQGYLTKTERLRSGTFTMRNLPRRLLATATVLYFRGSGAHDEGMEDVEAELDVDIAPSAKKKETEITISKDLRIPFVCVWLFRPNAIPAARTLSSPLLLMGALGDMAFLDKRTGQPVVPDSPVLALSNLAQVPVSPASKVRDVFTQGCWSPRRMGKYKLQGRFVRFESQKLLQIDSQEKIRALAEKVARFGHERKSSRKRK